MRCLMAEVKLPFSWPNNSLSINSDGIDAQFTSTRAIDPRLLFSCNQRATNSLPVPFSPVMSTRASVGATFSIVSLIFPMAGVSPMISKVLETFLLRNLVSVTRLFLSMALRIEINKRFKSGGLVMKS